MYMGKRPYLGFGDGNAYALPVRFAGIAYRDRACCRYLGDER